MIRLIFMTDFTESYAHKLLKGILKHSKSSEKWIVSKMPKSFKDKVGIQGVLSWCKSWKADVIIGQFDPNDRVEIFKEHDIIAIAQDYKTLFQAIPNITGDYLNAGRIAANYFIMQGFKSFAFYGYNDAQWSQLREEGFKKTLQQKIPTHTYSTYQQSINHNWSYEQSSLTKWVSSLPPNTCILACDDTMAMQIIEICHVLDIKIPNHLSILGIDDDYLTCELTYPNLSSIQLNIENAGMQAAQMIESHLRLQTPLHDIFVFPTTIIERESTSLSNITDKHIQKAINFLQQNHMHNISVNDIVKELPMSRRLLEVRFKRETGNTIHKYLMHLRLKDFQQRLLTTNDSIFQICLQTGFQDSTNIFRIFKTHTGLTPKEYRKKHTISPSL